MTRFSTGGSVCGAKSSYVTQPTHSGKRTSTARRRDRAVPPSPPPPKNRKTVPKRDSLDSPVSVPYTTIPQAVKNTYSQTRLIGSGAVNNGTPNFRNANTTTRRITPFVANVGLFIRRPSSTFGGSLTLLSASSATGVPPQLAPRVISPPAPSPFQAARSAQWRS